MGSNLARWESFNWGRHPGIERAKPAIVDWYNDLPTSGALVLAGNYGCGKTHIAEALADLYGRWRIAYYEEIELAKAIQHTYNDPRRSEEDIWSHIFHADLLILDDLGSYQTQNREWLHNLYNRLFNDYLTVRNRPMLITTNLSMYDEDLQTRIGARSFSRLCDALGSPNRYVDWFPVNDFRVERFLRT